MRPPPTRAPADPPRRILFACYDFRIGGHSAYTLNLARALEAAGAPVIGTSPESIDIAEDRERFQEFVDRLRLNQPANRTARDLQGAIFAARHEAQLTAEAERALPGPLRWP